jgi:YD repeat-containing protein
MSEYAATGVYLPTQILLGDGSSYTFDYELSTAPGHTSDTTGRISKITLPTGGYIQYAYTGTNCTDGSPLQVTKTVNDLTNSAVWSYTRTISSGIWTTTENTPLNTDVQWTFNAGGIPTVEKVYQASVGGTVLSETDTTYGSDGPSRNTLSTGAASRTVDYAYDSYGNMTAQYEYDWGSTTSPLRTTLYTYINSSSYINANLLGLPATQTIMDGSTTVAYTEYFYDGKLTGGSTDTSAIAMTNQSGAVGHDDANYGVSSTTPRGNLTRMVQYANPSGTPSGGLTTLYGYDSLGNLVKTIDPKGNITTISYADSWDSGSSSCSLGSGAGAYAHPTSVTQGYGSGSALTATATYNKCIGAVMSVVDPNSQTTTFGYGDPLLRLKSITTPDASTTPTVQYAHNHYASGSVPNANVVTQTLHSGSSTMTSTNFQDGLGRALKVQGTNSAYTQYAYGFDTTAHQSFQQVSNPYLSSPSYWTKTSYDPLGRTVGVIYQDGSPATTSYTDNCWTMNDPASHYRKLCTDALGRLYQVFEDPSGLNYQTTYLYNGLNNLLSATQSGGPVRSFTYDGLSRLITEHPAEAGTTTYSYLAGGTPCSGVVTAPCTRTDANSTITTLTYDTLNRLTGKIYSGSTVGTKTAAITYYYDQTSYNGLTITNGKGQRTGMSDASGQTAWGFDVTGRPTYIVKTISGSTNMAHYDYNIDGTTNNIRYFSGSNVTYSYNSAGQPTAAVDTASSFNFATGATYTEAGQLKTLVQGYTSTFAGITTSNAYNYRLQPWVLSESKPSATLFSLSYGYGATAGTNNGNVRVITNNLDSTRSQTYDYDALNRVANAQAGTSWGNTYVYDAFGNLRQKNQIPGVPGEILNVNVSTSSNQINSDNTLLYDTKTGAMLIDNFGNHWTYDAENHVVSVGGSSYLYDGDGNRVMKSGTNARIYWPGLDGSVLNELNTVSNLLVRNVYLNGTLVARREGNGNIHYPAVDHLSSARVVVSASGAVEDDLDYYPFGGKNRA